MDDYPLNGMYHVWFNVASCDVPNCSIDRVPGTFDHEQASHIMHRLPNALVMYTNRFTGERRKVLKPADAERLGQFLEP